MNQAVHIRPEAEGNYTEKLRKKCFAVTGHSISLSPVFNIQLIRNLLLWSLPVISLSSSAVASHQPQVPVIFTPMHKLHLKKKKSFTSEMGDGVNQNSPRVIENQWSV